MKVSSINSQSQLPVRKAHLKKNESDSSNVANNNPSFKAGGLLPMLSMSSEAMQRIENKGYLISFLIQDVFGMTLPRVFTGFNRDKDITGEYNIQEGLEVAGREGFTGPYIIFVAPVVLALTGMFCKSTNTNTRLIKRFGANFKDMISKPEFDKSIQKNKDSFKQEFYKYNLTKIYKDTVPNDSKSEETIKYILEEFDRYSKGDKKAKKEACANIVGRINNKILENSDKLLSLNKVTVGEGDTKTLFKTSEVIRALDDFGIDAIENNAESANISANAIDNIKNNFAAKRLLTNIANVVVTLGGLSVLPKLYTRGDVAPGAKTKEYLKNKEIANSKENKEQKDKQNDIVFKGKGINSDGFFAKFGKYITKYTPEKMQELLEYTGYNFTKTTFALLATLGLLLPRGIQAWNRAQVDEKGKRDMTEIHEILLRDTVSSLSVVFAVPFLTKALVKSYEDKLGFVLTNRASDGKSMFKKALDILNPYSDLEVLSVADLEAVYGNINSKSKLMNFSKFVSEKGGDLEKIISRSDNKNVMFNENTFTLDSIKNLSKEEKNKKIISLFEKIKADDVNAVHDGISKLMNGSGDIKKNLIAKWARGLNSLPGFISTVFISPIILGILIPKLTYYNTNKTNAKILAESKG